MPNPPLLTVADVAERLAYAKADPVLALIHSGELRAVNVASTGPAGRPRWRISEDDLAEFLAGRQHTPKKRATRQRRPKHVTNYF